MTRRSALVCLALYTLAYPSISQAQTDSIYRNNNAAAARATALGFFDNLGNDCSIGVTPEVIVKTTPKHGTLIVRSGKVKTKPTNRCSNLDVSVQAALYLGSVNYTGSDEVIFEVKSANRESH